MDIFGNGINNLPVNLVLSSSTPAVNNDIVVYDGTSGILMKDSGVNISSLGPIIGSAVLSDGNPSITGHLPEYKDTSSLLIGDNGIATSDVFLRTGTVAMTSSIDMGANELKNDLTVEFKQQNSVPAPSAGFSKIWVNTSGELSIKDNSNIPASILQNDGAVPMLAGFNFNTNPLLLCGHIETSNSNVNIGLASAVAGSSNVVVGSGASATDSGGNNCCVGHGAICGGQADILLGENTATSAGGAANIVIGSSAQVVGAGLTTNVVIGTGSVSNASGCVIIGENSSCAVTCFNTSMLGYQSTADGVGSFVMGGQCTSTGDRAHILCGDNVTNNVTNSVLIGDVNLSNIRPASSGVCDIGTGAAQFRNVYVGNIAQSNPSHSSIYNTASTVLSMTSGVIRTLPMVFNLNSESSNFSTNLSTGVISYIGVVTRLFVANATVGFTLGSGAGDVLQFGLTKNSALSFSSSRTSNDANIATVGSVVNAHLCDTFLLSTGDTIGLIGDLSVGANQNITYQYCNIVVSQV